VNRPPLGYLAGEESAAGVDGCERGRFVAGHQQLRRGGRVFEAIADGRQGRVFHHSAIEGAKARRSASPRTASACAMNKDGKACNHETGCTKRCCTTKTAKS
jgi:hypothetical protein